MDTYFKNDARKKLADWFDISEKDYIWYILQGYEIKANSTNVEWYLNNQRHRTDGPAREWTDGTRAWYLNGQRHRTDGPAREWTDGTRAWYLNGQRHRTDGPAREWTDGTLENRSYISTNVYSTKI